MSSSVHITLDYIAFQLYIKLHKILIDWLVGGQRDNFQFNPGFSVSQSQFTFYKGRSPWKQKLNYSKAG